MDKKYELYKNVWGTKTALELQACTPINIHEFRACLSKQATAF